MIVSAGYRKNGFDAFGGKVLRKGDMSHWMNDPDRTDPDGVALGLSDEVVEVKRDFFGLLPTISSIWMENPECRINMTKKNEKLFLKNNVIIRGRYDTSAEVFARQYHLRFLHLDVELASVGDYFEHGVDVITLRFYSDGRPYIHQDCMCQGISAGSMGGGEVSFDLPEDFYLTMTAEEIAGQCWRGKTILNNGILQEFLKKAKEKNGYFLNFKK